MNRLLNISIFLLLFLQLGAKSLIIDGKTYHVDTIANFTAGPGTQHIQVRLTGENRLDVYFLKIDTSNPYVTFKAALGRDSIYGGERPSAVAARKSTTNAVYFAGTNADFYNVTDYIGYPLGGCVVENEVVKVPVSNRRMIAFEDDKVPAIGIMAYTGHVKLGTQTWTLHGANHLRGANQLILYNQHNGKVTRTNNDGTEVVVKLKNGESWGVSNAVTVVVQSIHQGKGSLAIPKGYAILSGNGASATLLNSLSVNDELLVTLNMEMDGRKYNVSQMVGGDRFISLFRVDVTAFGETAVINPQSSPLRVNGRNLLVDIPTQIMLYNLMGVKVFEAYIDHQIKIPTTVGKGIFLLRTTDTVQKILLNT